MKPWREIAVPHRDVLEGTYQQSEFAADITAVKDNKASRAYQDAGAFYRRTYITEGMRLLLTQVAQRLNGQGGEPVTQLQTAFGGGKTHTMLAVYHLVTREGSLDDLTGIPELLDRAKIMDVPRAKIAVLDGTAHAPAQPWKRGKLNVHTLWGELAWQLGGTEAYERLAATDASGTSPGKDVLQELLAQHAPCVVLVDELVAYVRQFPDGQVLSGGSYDSNLSFVQALTEAIKLVPNAVLLASLPESEVEAGSSRGVSALRALEKTFGRVQALWKPVATEEAFEIVRRRLFKQIEDVAARDDVCRAFHELYLQEASKLPTETQERRYRERLIQAYPIHPEVFDRLYEDWSSLESFQRTRGVLKLMAHVVHELWSKGNADLLILPSSLPLYRGKVRDELLTHLAPGWDPVLDRDVDDDRAESAELDTHEARFGAVQAARRVARTTFFASAPSSQGTRVVTRGVDRARIVLGCVQPGQPPSVYIDALGRLADRLHYLNSSGDRAQDNTRYWFDTRATLRREMEDRKRRFDERTEVWERMAAALDKLSAGHSAFDGIHTFTPHADVPDDSQLRLVILDPGQPYTQHEPRPAMDAARDALRHHGAKPRFRANRLVFLAGDGGSIRRFQDAARTALAWESMVEDIDKQRLLVDQLQGARATEELATAEKVVVRAARDCYKWVLGPVASATDPQPKIEAFPMNPSAPSFMAELDRIDTENEIVIAAWSPIHLRSRLKELYWKDGRTTVKAAVVWEDMQKYLYLPRLADREVFEKVIRTGAGGTDFFATAYGQEGEKLEGFRFGDASGVQLDDTLLLVEPDAARAYQAAQAALVQPQVTTSIIETLDHGGAVNSATSPGRISSAPQTPRAATFIGTVDVRAAGAQMKLRTLAEEVIAVLASDPTSEVRVSVEIQADFPNGVPEHIKRAVSENAVQLEFKNKVWE